MIANSDNKLDYNSLLELLDKEEQDITLMLLSRNCIERIPMKLFTFINLTNLNLSSNSIVVLPRDIGRLSKLDRFTINGNLLREIPSSLGACRLLRFLDVSWNKLIRLPPTFTQLRSCNGGMITYKNDLPHWFSVSLYNSYYSPEVFYDFLEDIGKRFAYYGAMETVQTLMVLFRRRCLCIPKDVVRYVLTPLIWETRERSQWHAVSVTSKSIYKKWYRTITP